MMLAECQHEMSGRDDFYSAQENTFKVQSTFKSFNIKGSPWHWQQDDVIPNYLWELVPA